MNRCSDLITNTMCCFYVFIATSFFWFCWSYPQTRAVVLQPPTAFWPWTVFPLWRPYQRKTFKYCIIVFIEFWSGLLFLSKFDETTRYNLLTEPLERHLATLKEAPVLFARPFGKSTCTLNYSETKNWKRLKNSNVFETSEPGSTLQKLTSALPEAGGTARYGLWRPMLNIKLSFRIIDPFSWWSVVVGMLWG